MRPDLERLVAALHGVDEEAVRAARAVGAGGGPIVVSACLLGAPTRFDGRYKASPAVEAVTRGCSVLPLCPELLGGLGCPRRPVHLEGGGGADLLAGRARAIDDGGADRSPALAAGAVRAMALARESGATSAILKERSPSCGLSWIHTAAGLRAGRGVFAALAVAAGLVCRSEVELPGGAGQNW